MASTVANASVWPYSLGDKENSTEILERIPYEIHVEKKRTNIVVE